MKNEHLIKYKNPVILKDQEGKVKCTTYDLPHQKHTYGKKVIDDPQPIKYIVNNWQTAQTSAAQASKQKDYKQLNRRAISKNIHTAKDQYVMRSSMDIMVKRKQGKKVMPIMLPQQDFAYGVKNRPSTPVKLVIGNCYAIQQINKKSTQYLSETQKISSAKNKKLQPFKTKSQFLRQEKTKKILQQPHQNLSKMSRFTTSIMPKINTNLKAFKAHENNSDLSKNIQQNDLKQIKNS